MGPNYRKVIIANPVLDEAVSRLDSHRLKACALKDDAAVLVTKDHFSNLVTS